MFFDVPERGDGRTRWSLRGLIKLAINAVTSYSALPMQLVTFCGIGFMIFALMLLVQTLWMKLSGHAVAGFTTVIILLLVIGTVIMFSLGVIGVYLSKIYEEVKNRPRYIVSDAAEQTQAGEEEAEAGEEEEYKEGRGRIGA